MLWKYAKNLKIEYFTHIFLTYISQLLSVLRVCSVSVTLYGTHLIFSVIIIDIIREGTVPQIFFYLKPSFYFM